MGVHSGGHSPQHPPTGSKLSPQCPYTPQSPSAHPRSINGETEARSPAVSLPTKPPWSRRASTIRGGGVWLFGEASKRSPASTGGQETNWGPLAGDPWGASLQGGRCTPGYVPVSPAAKWPGTPWGKRVGGGAAGSPGPWGRHPGGAGEGSLLAATSPSGWEKVLQPRFLPGQHKAGSGGKGCQEAARRWVQVRDCPAGLVGPPRLVLPHIPPRSAPEPFGGVAWICLCAWVLPSENRLGTGRRPQIWEDSKSSER